jgi:peptidylprolyl isomerase
MELTLGKGEVIPGFERAIVGMRPGSMVIENVPATHAFGPFRAEMVWVIDRSSVLEQGALVGDQAVRVRTRSGKAMEARVVEVEGDRVKVDANHPLCGRVLTFEIELVEILSGRRISGDRIPQGARESKIILPPPS